MNMRIFGLPGAKKKELKSVVMKFLAEALDGTYPDLAQAFRIGNKGVQSCTIIVKFVYQVEHDTA